jgi:DNA-binding GntR family transcriptional regulator
MAANPVSDDWGLPPVQHASTIEQAHRLLRDAIVDGSISQGSHLRELHLARTLGTSRGTVREAIRHLVQEGLAEHKLHRGTFVLALSPRDWLDVYVAREAIEVGVVTRLLRSGCELDLAPLDAALAELRDAAEGQARPTERVIAADLRFHQELVRLGRSPRLDRAYETLAAEARMLLRRHPEYPWEAYVRDHVELLDALLRRDPRTPELVADHLVLSAELLGGAMAGRAAPEPSESSA